MVHTRYKLTHRIHPNRKGQAKSNCLSAIRRPTSLAVIKGYLLASEPVRLRCRSLLSPIGRFATHTSTRPSAKGLLDHARSASPCVGPVARAFQPRRLICSPVYRLWELEIRCSTDRQYDLAVHISRHLALGGGNQGKHRTMRRSRAFKPFVIRLTRIQDTIYGVYPVRTESGAPAA